MTSSCPAVTDDQDVRTFGRVRESRLGLPERRIEVQRARASAPSSSPTTEAGRARVPSAMGGLGHDYLTEKVNVLG